MDKFTVNSNSNFRGCVGTIDQTHVSQAGMVKVVFDRPLHGYTYSLFYMHELTPVTPAPGIAITQ